MMFKGFLTEEELRTGIAKIHQVVDRSNTKLHQHMEAKWSYIDRLPTEFVSPAKFERISRETPLEASRRS
jgi:hypothetical protein